MNKLIKASNLTYKYEGKNENAIDQISFDLMSGESLGILGPNGGGKSTLMKILSGVIEDFSGDLSVLNVDVQKNQFPYTQISYIPQTDNLNLSLPLRARDYLEFAGKSMGLKNLSEKIDQLSKQVGIFEKLDFLFKDMSGGEKQRVLIVKSLLNSPKILLLDEPTKGLDSLGQDQLLLLIKKIKEEYKTAIVIVDHNINQIIRHCDKVLCLNKNSHWHNHKEMLTKNILENIYHCEFEHLLIHENESSHNIDHADQHLYCNHGENHQHENKGHQFIFRRKE